jgi:imidazole glycerol-phosphate synthase subunit HisH
MVAGLLNLKLTKMKTYEVTVIDYGIGNVWSVLSALNYLGVKTKLVSDAEEISASPILILPGVGSFNQGMKVLKSRGLDKAILTAVLTNNAKILGICLGMQLMGSYSSEDQGSPGLGLIPNYVDKFSDEELSGNKVPHVGFNTVNYNAEDGFFTGLGSSSDFYFTHSYRMLVDGLPGKCATCTYDNEFLAAFQVGNIYGAQFHPEKSQTNGLLLLRNFIQGL